MVSKQPEDFSWLKLPKKAFIKANAVQGSAEDSSAQQKL